MGPALPSSGPGVGRKGGCWRKGREEAGGHPSTYSRSSKLDFLSSALWGMSLKNRLERKESWREESMAGEGGHWSRVLGAHALA